MKNSDTVDTVKSGNTKTDLTNNIRKRYWCFTLNNPTEDDIKNIDTTFNECTVYIIQLEQGENETKHLQGHIEFENARYFKAIKKLLPKAHWEQVRNKKNSRDYCMKSESRIDGPWSKGIPQDIKLIMNLYEWQTNIINLIDSELKKPNDRLIHWVYEYEGCTGKTQLAKYICKKYNAIYLNGKGADIKYGVTSYINQKETNRDNLICIFGYPREKEDYINYAALEEIKDGIWFNSKYESGMCIINPPIIIVFSNFKPDEEKLSKDRWHIINIGSQ